MSWRKSLALTTSGSKAADAAAADIQAIEFKPLSPAPSRRSWLGGAAAIGLAGLLGGCFQPMYGDNSLSNSPGLRGAMSSVDVAQIPAPNGTPLARVAVEARNQLVFELTGGAGATASTHRLNITMTSQDLSVIVDVTTARPDVQNYGIDVTYTLTELATGKVVVKGTTFARVSYDIPGQEQRFARARALRDAENRAAKVIAENLRNRLASYFVAKT